MTSAEFHEIVQQNGFYQNGMATYGVWNGYPFSMGKTKMQGGYYSQEMVKVVFFTMGELPKETMKSISQQYSKQVTSILMAKNGRVEVTFPYKKKENVQVGAEVLNAVTYAMAQNGVAVREGCAICGLEGCDCVVPSGEFYVPAHYKCIEDKAVAVKTKTETDLATGSYVSGLVGAVLGALVGILPTLFTIYFMDVYYAAACMLVPLAAYYGYKILKGKMTGATKWIVTGVSILQIPVIYTLITYFSLLNEGYRVTLLEVASFVLQYMATNPGSIFGDMLTMIIFFIIGIASVFGMISRTGTQEYEEQAGQLSMAVPMQEAKKGIQQAQPEAPHTPIV